MPCNLSAICYIDQHSETPGKSNFVVTAVGIVSSRQQNINIFIHIVAFYPKGATRNDDLERFKKGDIIKVQGRFSIIETEVDESKIKLIKMVASDICVLNLDDEDLPKSSLSVTLVGTASDNSEINDDKIILNLNAREYIDNQHNKSLSFDLYHFPEDSHLMPITTKVSRGSSLYVTGSLSLIGDLLLVRLTQINFIENTRSSPHKTSNYAWERKEGNDSSTQSVPLASEIAKSLSAKSNKRKVKNQATTISRSQKIPKLASLALTQSNAYDDPQEESSLSVSHLNIGYDSQNETQPDIFNDKYEQEEQEDQEEQKDKARPQRRARGRKKKIISD